MPLCHESADKVSTTDKSRAGGALLRREAIDFRAFPLGSLADNSGAKPAKWGLSSCHEGFCMSLRHTFNIYANHGLRGA